MEKATPNKLYALRKTLSDAAERSRKREDVHIEERGFLFCSAYLLNDDPTLYTVERPENLQYSSFSILQWAEAVLSEKRSRTYEHQF